MGTQAHGEREGGDGRVGKGRGGELTVQCS